jgi:hypothetical protein
VSIHVTHRDVTPEIEQTSLTIHNEADLGSGIYKVKIRPKSLESNYRIAAIEIQEPDFQLTLTINVLTKDIPVFLGRADGPQPITWKIFRLPADISIDRHHEFTVTFTGWEIESLKMDGILLGEITDPSSTLTTAKTTNSDIILDYLATVLKEMFGNEWLQNPKRKNLQHPAVKSWKIVQKLIDQGRVFIWPEDIQLLPLLASIILDNYFIVQCSGGDVSHFSLGDFANYGDELVRNKLKSEIRNVSGYKSKITELAYAAWHLSKGHRVTAFEDAGYPDFRVESDEFPLPIVVDCKHVMGTTKLSRIPIIIRKANKQVKELGVQCNGIVAIDVSEKVPNPDHLSNEIPESVQKIESIVKGVVRKFNSSISAVLLMWDDYSVSGSPNESGTSWVGIRRRSRLIRHTSPLNELQDTTVIGEYGNTLILPIFWTPRT